MLIGVYLPDHVNSKTIVLYNKVTRFDFNNANAWYQEEERYSRIEKTGRKGRFKIANGLKIS